MARKKKERLKKKVYLLFIIVLLLFIGVLFVINKDRFLNTVDNIVEKLPTEEVKKLEIVDIESKSRPIAIMINNHPAARKFHTGLQEAYLTYEIIVEGGYTRYMSLFKDVQLEKVGSVRSSRHYFLDYVLENDAIYAHFGWSDPAMNDISSFGINNINGLYDDYTWRDTSLDRAYEHTAFTSIENITKQVNNKGYRTETNQDLLLNYSVDEINLESKNDSIVANNVSIQYSYYHTTSYEYDSVNKVYKRSMSGVANTDLVTGEQYTVKNIITYQVEDVAHESIDKLRNLKNIGSGTGYYITNGYAVPITWEKSSRSGQTIYKYQDGNEIDVNDGNTFIQIQPKNMQLTIN